MMTKAYSIAFKQKMVERLTGKHAVSPSQLGREIGIRQQDLSRWLHEARSLPLVASNTPKSRVWTVEQKAQVIADASKLSGEQLTAVRGCSGCSAMGRALRRLV
jgi:transposase